MSKQVTRPGAGAVGNQPTGGTDGVRVGNTPAVSVDIDSFPQRHRSANKRVEKTSRNWDTREGGKEAKENT